MKIYVQTNNIKELFSLHQSSLIFQRFSVKHFWNADDTDQADLHG